MQVLESLWISPVRLLLGTVCSGVVVGRREHAFMIHDVGNTGNTAGASAAVAGTASKFFTGRAIRRG